MRTTSRGRASCSARFSRSSIPGLLDRPRSTPVSSAVAGTTSTPGTAAGTAAGTAPGTAASSTPASRISTDRTSYSPGTAPSHSVALRWLSRSTTSTLRPDSAVSAATPVVPTPVGVRVRGTVSR